MIDNNDNYCFLPMTSDYADEIAYIWKYEDEYSFCDMTADEEYLKEFIDPSHWSYIFAVTNNEDELIGFSTYHFENEIMWIGFGLKPTSTGKGNGEKFVRSVIDFGVLHFDYKEYKILLSVAEFNKRAIKLYTKLGFQSIEQKNVHTNGDIYPFVVMGKVV